ncbi:MAG: ribonuclease P protein component [Saprospiraceae bacterium]|nr:ribonuclease P protein component [Saprospiraceae bacterium]
MRFTFNKSARLSSRKDIKELFEKGSSFFLFPFKVLYLEDPQQSSSTHQVLISVPKKNHKSAVKRNRIKRLIREAYRLNQHIISEVSEKKLLIAYIYVSGDVLPYKEVETKLKKVLIRLKNIVQGKESSKPE